MSELITSKRATLTQQTWTAEQATILAETLRNRIAYLDYFSEANELPLPRRLSLTNDKLRLKLVIERWQQLPTTASDADLFPVFD